MKRKHYQKLNPILYKSTFLSELIFKVKLSNIRRGDML